MKRHIARGSEPFEGCQVVAILCQSSLQSLVVVHPYFVMNQSNMCRKTVFGCFTWIGLHIPQIAFGRFAMKTLERAAFIVSSLLVVCMCCFETFVLIVGCAHGEVWNIINFLWEGEVT
jgi:hypothetical protein